MSKDKAEAPADPFRQTLAELLKARHPVLLVESYEEDRVVEEITAVASDPDLVRTVRGVRVWSATSGLAEPGETGPAGTAETFGITGKTCFDYVPLLEELLEAETVQSEFTADYQATGEHLAQRRAETVREQPSS